MRRLAPLRHDAVQSLIDAYVAKGAVPGAVVALVEPGRHRPVFLSAGVTAFGGSEKATPDTLWRIYSMSKPITGVAMMILFEEGRPAEAVAAHREAVRLKPDAPLLRVNLAHALIETNDKAKLDEAIKTLRANGKYQEINQKYFKYDIYGG